MRNLDLGGRTGSVGPPPFSREQGGCDIQLANIAPDGRAEKECVIGKVTVRHHLFHSSLLLSYHYLESFSTELCPAAASLKSLLLCMVPLFPTVHVQGRMSKVRHSLTCQRMAKFASLCCKSSPKKKWNKLNVGVWSPMWFSLGMVRLSHCECSAEEQAENTFCKPTLLICMGTGKYRNGREKLFP